jgi:co-chaperonin GroES (HSP10)
VYISTVPRYRRTFSSLAIAHLASTTHRQLARTAAAEKKRQQQKADAGISLQQGGTMYIHQGRNAAIQKEGEKLLIAKAKYERLQKTADNKAKAIVQKQEVAGRKTHGLAIKLAKHTALNAPRRKRN